MRSRMSKRVGFGVVAAKLVKAWRWGGVGGAFIYQLAGLQRLHKKECDVAGTSTCPFFLPSYPVSRAENVFRSPVLAPRLVGMTTQNVRNME
jgi:hypothetical protein